MGVEKDNNRITKMNLPLEFGKSVRNPVELFRFWLNRCEKLNKLHLLRYERISLLCAYIDAVASFHFNKEKRDNAKKYVSILQTYPDTKMDMKKIFFGELCCDLLTDYIDELTGDLTCFVKKYFKDYPDNPKEMVHPRILIHMENLDSDLETTMELLESADVFSLPHLKNKAKNEEGKISIINRYSYAMYFYINYRCASVHSMNIDAINIHEDCMIGHSYSLNRDGTTTRSLQPLFSDDFIYRTTKTTLINYASIELNCDLYKIKDKRDSYLIVKNRDRQEFGLE